MKLIKKNTYTGNINKKIIATAITLGVVGGILFGGINIREPMTISEISQQSIISDSEKTNFISSSLEQEKIFPLNSSSVINDEIIDKVIEEMSNNNIKIVDSKNFRDYVLKNYIEVEKNNNNSVESIVKEIDSCENVVFNKNGLDYEFAIDYKDRTTDSHIFISQTVSNKNIKFSSVKFIHKYTNFVYHYNSYEIIFKRNNKQSINSILVENDTYYENINVKIKLSNDEEIVTTMSQEACETLKNNILNSIDSEYDKKQFEEENDGILTDLLNNDSYKVYKK